MDQIIYFVKQMNYTALRQANQIEPQKTYAEFVLFNVAS